MKDYKEEIKNIFINNQAIIVGDGIPEDGYVCGDSWSVKNVQDDILSLIREIANEAVGDRKSVDELKETMGSAYNDLSVQVAYKEGYNTRGSEILSNIEEMIK